MLTFTLMQPEGILRLHPSGPLTEADFARLRAEVMPICWATPACTGCWCGRPISPAGKTGPG